VVNPKTERSRLGDLLVDMRLVDEETLQAALAEQKQSQARLPTILAQRRVLDEERLTKAVAARLGLEAVSVASHKIHERVLALVPHALAKRFGLLPIAIKRTQQAEVLYLVMMDPLNTEALGEVQRITGRQVRVLMASATELDQCIEAQYAGLEAKLAASGSSRPARSATNRPPIVQGTAVPPTPSTPAAAAAPRSSARRAASVVAAPGRARGSSGVARPSGAPTRTPPPALAQNSRPAPSRPGELRAPRAASTAQAGPTRGRTPPPNLSKIPGPTPTHAPSPPALPQGSLPQGTSPISSPPPAKPAPFPARQPLDLGNPATLIDTARPPEIQGLAGQLSQPSPRIIEPAGVVAPSPMDPPDGVATRVGAEPSPKAPPPVDVPAQSPEKPGLDWALGDQDWPSEDVWSGLDAADAAVAPSDPTQAPDDADDQWAQSTGLDMVAPSDMDEDGPEDIATSQWELSEMSQAALRPEPEPAPPPKKAAAAPAPAPVDRRTLASTLEVPVHLDDRDNPFDGPGPDDVPTGLERTGIFPAIDFGDDGFEPPDLAGGGGAAHPGLSDIPESDHAVRARFSPPRGEDDDPIEAIEEIVLEPIDEEPSEQVDLESMEIPTVERPSPASAVPPAPMPVIEPSSLASLLDDEALDNEDTGSAPTPSRPTPPPETRVFDESSRKAPPPPADHSPAPEEPTNPRMEAAVTLEAPAPPPLQPVLPAPFPAPVPKSAPVLPPLVTPPASAPAPEASAAPLAKAPTPAPKAATPLPKVPTPPPAVEPSEEPTPARDTVERADVLSALEGAFVPRAESVPSTPPPSSAASPTAEMPSGQRAEAQRLTKALVAGSSLNSPERAQLVIALGRLMLSKGLITEDELTDMLILDS